MDIWALSATSAGLNTITLLAQQVQISGVIGLEESAGVESVAGYKDIRTWAAPDSIQIRTVRSYTLDHASDRELFDQLSIDLLLVVGWQRLIPDWLIGLCRVGALGLHGSPLGITKGRGRSPQNWSLLLGMERFELSVFWIEAGIDNGAVIETGSYPLSSLDDIQSSYVRSSLLAAELISRAIASGAVEHREGTPQRDEAEYFPMRRPEDGEIDWNRTGNEIHDFVRAQTRPFPGAFSTFGQSTVRIWRVIPLTGSRGGDASPGEVVLTTASDTLVVQAGDSPVLVCDWTLDDPKTSPPRKGDLLRSSSFPAQMDRIRQRHADRFPQLPISTLLHPDSSPSIRSERP